MLKEVWRNIKMEGWDAFVLKKKLKGVKEALKKWNVKEFGLLNVKIKKIEKDFNELDIIEEQQGELCEKDCKKRLQLQEDYWRVAELNESLLCQKSRV